MDDAVAAKVKDFFGQYTKLSFSKGSTLIPANTPSGVYYLENGYVRQFQVSNSGEELLVNIYKPGTFFPATWIVADLANRHFFEAVTKVECFRAPKEAVLHFMKKEPRVTFELLKRILIGLNATVERVENLTLTDARQRVAHTIYTYALRFAETVPETNTVRIELQLKQETLASIAGITKETWSREVSKLKRERIIENHSNFLHITNIKALEKITQG